MAKERKRIAIIHTAEEFTNSNHQHGFHLVFKHGQKSLIKDGGTYLVSLDGLTDEQKEERIINIDDYKKRLLERAGVDDIKDLTGISVKVTTEKGSFQYFEFLDQDVTPKISITREEYYELRCATIDPDKNPDKQIKELHIEIFNRPLDTTF